MSDHSDHDSIEEQILQGIRDEEGLPYPKPGHDVWYQTDGRNYDYFLPAKVVVTMENQNIEGLNEAGIPIVETKKDVHLRVFSPGEDYVEYNVPYDPQGSRRSWRWPEAG